MVTYSRTEGQSHMNADSAKNVKLQKIWAAVETAIQLQYNHSGKMEEATALAGAELCMNMIVKRFVSENPDSELYKTVKEMIRVTSKPTKNSMVEVPRWSFLEVKNALGNETVDTKLDKILYQNEKIESDLTSL